MGAAVVSGDSHAIYVDAQSGSGGVSYAITTIGSATTGYCNFGGHVGIGTQYAQSNVALHVGNATIDASSGYGAYVYGTATPTQNRATLSMAIVANSRLNAAFNWGALYGVYAILNHVPTSGTVTAGYGVYAVASITNAGSSGVAFTTLNNFIADTPTRAGGSTATITTNRGLFVNNMGAAFVTHAYGVYIAAQSNAATVNCGLYNLGVTRLDDTTFIGGSTFPTAAGTTRLGVDSINLDSASGYAQYNSGIAVPTADRAANSVMGIQANGQLSAAFAWGAVYGGRFEARHTAASALITNAYGLYSMVQMTNAGTSGTMITSAKGLEVGTPTRTGGTGTITNSYGINLNNPGAAFVTNAYALYIAAVSGTKYRYSAGWLR